MRQNSHLAWTSHELHHSLIDETLITRQEVVALPFNVSDIAASLERIEALLEEEEDGEEDNEG
jgi:hypothetical protein